MNENKTNINWLITIYPRIGENLGKIRNCEIQHLACFIKIILKINIKMGKTPKKSIFLAGIK